MELVKGTEFVETTTTVSCFGLSGIVSVFSSMVANGIMQAPATMQRNPAKEIFQFMIVCFLVVVYVYLPLDAYVLKWFW